MTRFAVVLMVGTVAGSAGPVRACPNCAEAMPGSAKSPPAAAASTPAGEVAAAPAAPVRQAGLADGFYWSILLMLAVPYTLAAGVGLGIYRVARTRRPAAVSP